MRAPTDCRPLEVQSRAKDLRSAASYSSASCWHKRASQSLSSRTSSSSRSSVLFWRGGVGGFGGASARIRKKCVARSAARASGLAALKPPAHTTPSTSSLASTVPPPRFSASRNRAGRFDDGSSLPSQSPSFNWSPSASTEWSVARQPQSSHCALTSACNKFSERQARRRPQSGSWSLSTSIPNRSSPGPSSPGPFQRSASSANRPVSYASRSSPEEKGPSMGSNTAAPASTSRRGVAASSSTARSRSGSSPSNSSSLRQSTGSSARTSPGFGRGRWKIPVEHVAPSTGGALTNHVRLFVASAGSSGSGSDG